MALGIGYDLIFSLQGLLQGSAITALPVFILAIIGAALRRKLAGRFRLSWLNSAFLATYILVLIIAFALYFTPLVASLGQGYEVPLPFQEPLGFQALVLLAVPLRLALVCIALALLLMPLELIGSLVSDSLNQRFPKINYYLNSLASVFVAVFIAALLALWLLPEVFGIDAITGVLYLLFYGTG